MKTVVLSCNTGEGHNAAGKAVYEKFLQMGAACDFVDTLSVAVMPHLFPAECLTSLKKHGALDIPFVCIATDYACIPFWEETNPDYFIIPHKDLAEDFYSRNIPREKLLPFGIPVRDAFRQKTDRSEARRILGLPDDKPILLLMSGSMGFGGLETMTAALYEKFRRGVRIIVL